MRILPKIVRKNITPLITTVMMLLPAKTNQCTRPAIADSRCFASKIVNVLDNSVLRDLKVVQDTNFVGGITHKFDEKSVAILKKRIYKIDSSVEYKAPIENDKNVYLEPFGMFFANRPGRNIIRPHLGLDIFVSPYSRKPQKPVLVQAPLDGVVISHKIARKEDNVIGNKVIMLGVDGRRYGFDHLARPDDYSDSIPLPKVGTILKAGDKIGYVGCTGETTLWHTHLTVMTDEKLEYQLNSDFWKEYSKKTPYCVLSGQVNPLDSVEAGPIAKLLREYRGAKKLPILSEKDFAKQSTKY